MLTKYRLFVHIYVTPICNLKCKHCYYDAKPINSKIEHALTILNIANIIVSLCDQYDAFFDIEGGEFFLRDDISELFDILPPDYWGRITVTTNGTTKITLTPDVILKLDEFRISVEGHTDELQKELRNIGLTPVMKTCSELRSAGIPFVLRITLHKKNFQYLVEMLQWFIKQGFDRFSLYEFQSTGRGRQHEVEYALGENELAQALKGLCVHPLLKDMKLIKISLSARRVSLVHSIRRELEQEGFEVVDLSGAASLTVNYDGSLGICPWKVGIESIGSYDPRKFILDVQQLVEHGKLNHLCNHCSTVRIMATSDHT